MKLNMAFVMDPIETIDIEKDTTFVIMLESQARGHLISYLELKDLYIEDGKTYGFVSGINLKIAPDFFKFSERSTVPLESFDVIWMRKDPPFNMDYIYATYILGLINPEKTIVINNPKGLKEANEKFYALNFPELIPPTVVTKDISILKNFLAKVGGEIVVKPLDSCGGEGVFYVKEGDRNSNVIVESITDGGKRYVLGQRFIKKVSEGDKRIILLNGVPIGAVLRIARAGGEFRCNFHSGGSPVKTELTRRDIQICETLAPKLRVDGLYFVGIDVIGGCLTEVNTTSPTGIQEINRLSGTKLEANVLDFVEKIWRDLNRKATLKC
jgi:glutathione synthase